MCCIHAIALQVSVTGDGLGLLSTQGSVRHSTRRSAPRSTKPHSSLTRYAGRLPTDTDTSSVGDFRHRSGSFEQPHEEGGSAAVQPLATTNGGSDTTDRRGSRKVNGGVGGGGRSLASRSAQPYSARVSEHSRRSLESTRKSQPFAAHVQYVGGGSAAVTTAQALDPGPAHVPPTAAGAAMSQAAIGTAAAFRMPPPAGGSRSNVPQPLSLEDGSQGSSPPASPHTPTWQARMRRTGSAARRGDDDWPSDSQPVAACLGAPSGGPPTLTHAVGPSTSASGSKQQQVGAGAHEGAITPAPCATDCSPEVSPNPPSPLSWHPGTHSAQDSPTRPATATSAAATVATTSTATTTAQPQGWWAAVEAKSGELPSSQDSANADATGVSGRQGLQAGEKQSPAGRGDAVPGAIAAHFKPVPTAGPQAMATESGAMISDAPSQGVQHPKMIALEAPAMRCGAVGESLPAWPDASPSLRPTLPTVRGVGSAETVASEGALRPNSSVVTRGCKVDTQVEVGGTRTAATEAGEASAASTCAGCCACSRLCVVCGCELPCPES